MNQNKRLHAKQLATYTDRQTVVFMGIGPDNEENKLTIKMQK